MQLRGYKINITPPNQYRLYHQFWLTLSEITEFPGGPYRVFSPSTYDDKGRLLNQGGWFWYKDDPKFGRQSISHEIRVWRKDGKVQGHCDFFGFLAGKEAEELLALRRQLDDQDSLVRAYRQEKLPCAERGYHRCDCCGCKITEEQVKKGDLVLGFCRDCGIDLYPKRSSQHKEAALWARTQKIIQESQALARKEQGK